MDILIIGGTRNMGHLLSVRLHQAGHNLTILNRGISRNDLPSGIQHLRADRTIPAQLEQALNGKRYDAVIDFALFDGGDAEVIVELLHGKIGRYIFISTGQVYLLRYDLTRPFREDDYAGECIPEPQLNTYDHEEWTYGLQKRHAEDVFMRAFSERRFPYTSLRLPMVNSERDPFNRLYGYILRIKDGGPVLVPDTPDYLLRHVYAGDVIQAIERLIQSDVGKGEAYNIAQDETLSLEGFLTLLGEQLQLPVQTVSVERRLLEANGFLPDCSPFSDLWMSELSNDKSKAALGMAYTPLAEVLATLVNFYEENPPASPISYRRRNAERQFAERLG
jgi:nucleoside-diphosphate-sugar epimerase